MVSPLTRVNCGTSLRFGQISQESNNFKSRQREMHRNMSDELDALLEKHVRLTETVGPLVRNFLSDAGIPFLAVTGRTKERASVDGKCAIKNYSDPIRQLTDLTGIRVIVYVESDVAKAVAVIRSAFRVDEENSIDKDRLLSVREAGYRSVHLVCDVGEHRERLQEYAGLAALKFEIQVRTVLQHAWAELEHDKNYKFKEGLPNDMQRQLYLHAGLLELADRGLDRLAREIDQYVETLRQKAQAGDLSSTIDSVSLLQFVEQWAAQHGVKLREIRVPNAVMPDLLRELDACGIKTLTELNDAIPTDYAEEFLRSWDRPLDPNVFSVVRDWLLIKDAPKLGETNWCLTSDDMTWLAKFLPKDKLSYIHEHFVDEEEYPDHFPE